MATIDTLPPEGALSQLLSIKSLMEALASRLGLDELPLPGDYIDIIGGSGLGGYGCKERYYLGSS
jgi:hypothetical protein